MKGLPAIVEENFTNWDDDADMLRLLVQNFLNKPSTFNFQELISQEKWQFGKDLLETVLEKKEVTMEYIKPKLKNWDPERIAVLDMILMRMGVCEFLYFETIPPKVTINEYIDLAKEYSTPQSGQFVNGILDNIHKDLVKDDKMHKVAFKPSRSLYCNKHHLLNTLRMKSLFYVAMALGVLAVSLAKQRNRTNRQGC